MTFDLETERLGRLFPAIAYRMVDMGKPIDVARAMLARLKGLRREATGGPSLGYVPSLHTACLCAFHTYCQRHQINPEHVAL